MAPVETPFKVGGHAISGTGGVCLNTGHARGGEIWICFHRVRVGARFFHFGSGQSGIQSTARKRARIAGIDPTDFYILVGFAVDRIFAPRVAIAILFACICGVLALATFGTAVAVPAAFVIGFSVGAEVDLIGYLVARYFGMDAYGQIYGRQYSTFLIATGLSPVILGAVRDVTGGYTASLFTAGAFITLSAVLFARLPKFKA